MEVIEYSVVEMNDPTGILEGKRYEFRIYVKFDEEDELYTEEGTGIRAIYVMNGANEKIASYHLFDRSTESRLEFALDEEEEVALAEFCKDQLTD
ncbi:pullulanase [Sporosarcina sp. Sa2YVA2]|uniref:Pullulanase n=1 Tax=Sporosarcina quadrami TaxID=2762234 RepID=A0ABR8U883_9BACL|nr:DUF6509 family protein [Sporosarcina quadrami]MBD7984249.1 pullulanase [Sporosarcina quadrami]